MAEKHLGPDRDDAKSVSVEGRKPHGRLRDSPRQLLALLILTLAGAFLRIYKLGSDLWLDEIASSVTYFRLPFVDVFNTYYSANQHLLYSAAASVSFTIFGESAWSARLPAALMGVAALPGFWWMARPVVSSREALWGTALLAVSYHHIWFSQSARGYSGMILCTILGTGILVRLAGKDRTLLWVLYVVAMTIGIGFLQNTAFVVGGHCTGWMIARLKGGGAGRRIVPMVVAAFVIAILSVGLHSLILSDMLRYFQTVDRTGLGWYDLRGFMPIVMSGLRAGLGLAGLSFLSVVMMCGWFDLIRSNSLIAMSALVAPALNLLALMVLKQGAYPRSFLYILPFALLFAVHGGFLLGHFAAKRLRLGRVRRLMESLPVILLVAASLSALPVLYRYPKQDYRGALRYALSHRRPGETVAAAGLAGVAYRQRYAPDMRVVESNGDLAVWCGQGKGAWVVYSFTRDMRLRHARLYDFIQERMRPAATFPGTLGDGNLYVAHCAGSL